MRKGTHVGLVGLDDGNDALGVDLDAGRADAVGAVRDEEGEAVRRGGDRIDVVQALEARQRRVDLRGVVVSSCSWCS